MTLKAQSLEEMLEILKASTPFADGNTQLTISSQLLDSYQPDSSSPEKHDFCYQVYFPSHQSKRHPDLQTKETLDVYVNQGEKLDQVKEERYREIKDFLKNDHTLTKKEAPSKQTIEPLDIHIKYNQDPAESKELDRFRRKTKTIPIEVVADAFDSIANIDLKQYLADCTRSKNYEKGKDISPHLEKFIVPALAAHKPRIAPELTNGVIFKYMKDNSMI